MADTLPESASTAVYLHLAAARVKELHHLDQELSGCKSGKGGRCYQKLPRHMQRRALSSNPKRLPRRLRRRHLAEGVPPKPTKRPASKHRPRPRARPSCSASGDHASAASRVDDYVRRQGTPGNTWLETHVWHAKRFHMARRWGYALPLRPTQKMYRPTLRAVEHRCVMQDVSFLCCVEVQGAGLLRGLQACTAHCAQARLQGVWGGGTWDTFTLYRPHKCPVAAVCEVDLQRLPSARGLPTNEEQEEEEGRLWMWVHPASHHDLLDLLCEVFTLQRVTQSERCAETEPSSGPAHDEDKENCEVMDVEDSPLDGGGVVQTSEVKESLPPNNTGADCSVKDQASVSKSKVKRKHHLLHARLTNAGVPDYVSKNKKVSVFCLKDTLNRFRLRGPEAHDILKSILVPSSIISESLKNGTQSTASELDAVKPRDSSTQQSNPTCDENSATKCGIARFDGKANNGGGICSSQDAEDSSGWWEKHYADPRRREEQSANAACWAEQPSVQDNVVLPLVVRDPRVLLPCKRAKIDQTRARLAPRPLSVRDVGQESALYDPSLRLLMLRQRHGDHHVNGIRQRSGVPGAVLPLTSDETRLTVLVLLRRLRHSVGAAAPRDSYNIAYDVILPGGWGSNFWTGLVYAGAVAVGVDSEVHFMREEHTPPPPYLLPDLPAGRLHEQRRAQELRQEYFNLPPDKRPNFIKLGVQFPFSFPWSKLTASLRNRASFKSTHESEIGREFSSEVLQELGLPDARSEDTDSISDCDECCVLRNPRYLNALDVLTCPSGSRRRVFRGLDKAAGGMEIGSGEACVSAPASDGFRQFEDCLFSHPLKEDVTALQETMALMQRTSQLQLVRVQVTLIGKGSVEPLALICRPSASDLRHLKEALTNEQSPSLDVSSCAVEPSRADENEEKRRQLKREHEKDQAKLHRLRKATRRRVRREHEDCSGSLDEALNAALQLLDGQQQELISRKESYASASESLWLMSPEAPLQECSRLIVGCLTDASFSRLRGCGVGQGYVPMGALLPTCQHRLERYQQRPPSPADMDGQAPRKKQKLGDGAAKPDDAGCSAAFVSEGDPTRENGSGGHGEDLDVDLPFIQERGIAVLVRNRNSLHYRFGLLTVCCQQPAS